MKLNLPKIIRPLKLTDFAPELTHDDGGPAVVQVWVNPPAPLVTRQAELHRQAADISRRIQAAAGDQAALAEIAQAAVALGNEVVALFAELWSQHADSATHWTADEVKQVAASEANPALYGWLTERTINMINDYRSGLRKN